MKRLIILILVMLMGLASVSYAGIVNIQTNVVRTLVADQDRWGGCMIYIDHKLSDDGLDCPGRWVSFSCNGTFTTKDVANRMFDSALMAYALGKRVQIQVDDTRKLNGVCYGTRIEVLP